MKLACCVNGPGCYSPACMASEDTLVADPQSAGAVLMVRPALFAFNPQTAASNAFQRAPGVQGDEAALAAAPSTHALALREFDALAGQLQRAGIEVLIAHDTAQPAKPDAIFPNNWISFHRDGTVVLYPMLALNRRLERRDDIIEQVARDGHFHIARTVDLAQHEAYGKFLEGTGSMVLDRAQRLAYACVSPRTDLDVLGEFAQMFDYELVVFDARDATGTPVYHTNVLMAVGSTFAVLCGEVIVDPAQRAAVREKLRSTGHQVLEISAAQMREFGGNVLELTVPGGKIVALSTTAWRSFSAAQRRLLEAHAGVLAVDIPVIERHGGGGVRCMLAEIHLRKRSATAVS